MRLKRLWIGEFKNLKDFTIEFDDSPYTVLVGENGAGKSNLFEALVLIFDTLERLKPPPFPYSLSYTSRLHQIEIDCTPNEQRTRAIALVRSLREPEDRELLKAERLRGGNLSNENRLLPEFIFGYYSGFCGRFGRPFESYEQGYSRRARILPPGTAVPRRLLYGDSSLSDLLLVSLWAHQVKYAKESTVLKALNIAVVRDVSFTTRPPERFDPETHEPRTMGLTGMMRDFVDALKTAAQVGPLESIDGGRRQTVYRLDDEWLGSLARKYSKPNSSLFNVLFEARRQGVLAAVSFRLCMKNGSQIVLDDLSEGEKQLLLVLGVLRFAEHEEALFLLDEPCTYLNPRWSVDYVGSISDELGHEPKSQVVFATHDPLVLTGLEASQIRLLGRDPKTGSATVSPFPYSPKEMGVDGLLTSELFGLRSSIGTGVQEMINRRASLLAKGDALTPEEGTELQQLTGKLDGMGFAKVFDDPIYTRFVAAMGKRPEFMKPVLTPAEMGEQERYAERVLDEIMKEPPSDPH